MIVQTTVILGTDQKKVDQPRRKKTICRASWLWDLSLPGSAGGVSSVATVGPHGSMAQVMARDLATGYISGRCVPGFGGGRRMKSRGEVRREAKTPQKADGRTAW